MPSPLHPALHRAHVALDAMPHGAVVLDRLGHAWQQGRIGSVGDGFWYRSFGDDSYVSSFELAQLAPITPMTAGTPIR